MVSGHTMVGCAAFGCSNRSEKGFRMYGFPKDQERRKRWMAMVSCQNLQMTEASNSRKLCHVHFEDDQFTSTKTGGKLKLRPDAVPTIFIHQPELKRRKPPSGSVPPAPIQSTTDHTYYAKLNFGIIHAEIEEEIEVDFKGNERHMTGDEESDQEDTMPEPGAPGTRLPGTDRVTMEDLIRQLKTEKLMRRRAERALAQQKRINLALRKMKNLVNQKFTQMFNRDQIRALGREKKRGIRWGKETIKKAIQIKFTAGTAGYKTLQQMQIPLPNIRTLQRRMQHVNLEPGVLGEVLEMLRLKAGGMSEMERE
ncbi:hypothetical protein UPYG_G00109540 [Umbra pygmaea]|uniref:THAP domain-containing protein 1 n=1 Tax=Umbra pygmaea TaxID=75934 RepID=A0ABD0X6E2_UMBPY